MTGYKVSLVYNSFGFNNEALYRFETDNINQLQNYYCDILVCFAALLCFPNATFFKRASARKQLLYNDL